MLVAQLFDIHWVRNGIIGKDMWFLERLLHKHMRNHKDYGQNQKIERNPALIVARSQARRIELCKKSQRRCRIA